MKAKCQQKYLSIKSIRLIKKNQKKMQMKEFEKKGRRARAIHFYSALDDLLRRVQE